jgi:hypothetical protein
MKENKQKTNKKNKKNKPHNPKGITSTLGYQKSINANPSHMNWETKANHRETVDEEKPKTEVQDMEREKMELLHGM